VTPRPSNEGKKLRGQAHNPPGRPLPRPRRPGRHHRPTTRGLAIATALVALVGVAFYGALGNHGGRASSLPADDLEGMTDPRVTQANIQATICRRGYTRTVRPPREVTDAIKHQLVAGVGGNMWGRVEERRGSLGHAATLRFLSPLIEPDVRFRIRLSDKTQAFALERL
jgi:hypothetical protein